METFADPLTLRLLDDAFVGETLTAVGLDTLFSLVYELPSSESHGVTLERVRRRRIQLPVFETLRIRGREEHLLAAPKRVTLDREHPRAGRQEWLDAYFEVDLAVVLEASAGPLEGIRSADLLAELGEPGSLDELRAALVARFGDEAGAATFEKLHITSLEDLKRGKLLVELQGAEPPPFDPGDPANTEVFPLALCVKVEPELEVRRSLRAALLCRSLMENEGQHPRVYQDAEVRRPYAFVTLYPDSAAVDDLIPGVAAGDLKAQIANLYAAEEMAVHFVPGT